MSHSLGLSIAGLSAFSLVLLGQLTGCGDDVTVPPTTASSTATTSTGGSAQGGGGQGGVGGGGQGGGGAPPLTGTDTCPGDPYTFDHGDLRVLHGDTSLAADDYQSCGDGSGPDLVYQLTFANAGTVAINYLGLGDLDPAMHLRTTCEDDGTVVWCRDFSSTERVFKRHVDAGTYYLIVDGAAQTAGEYDLTINFTAPVCGDGALNPGEDCDDGNTSQGDGCDVCTLEPGSFDSCADPQVFTIDPGHTVLTGTTIGNTHQHTFNKADCTIGGVPPGPDDAGSPDRVYRLMPSANGTMTIVLGLDPSGTNAYCDITADSTLCWDRVLHVRHVPGMSGTAICVDTENVAMNVPPSAATQIACEAFGTMANGYTQTVAFPVTAGESYYVFVDGFYSGEYGQGVYNVHIDLN